MKKNFRPFYKNNKPFHKPFNHKKNPTSWEPSSDWYDGLVGAKGHYYHEHVILPHLLRLLNIKGQESLSLLDLACGQGVLARNLPQNIQYTGIDISPSLINSAKEQSKKNKNHQFYVGDVTTPFPIEKKDFDVATIVLALQNLANPPACLKNASSHLKRKSKLYLVINHPCFRIPRQSSWIIDENTHQQARKIFRYMSTMEIPLLSKPGQEDSEKLISYHYNLSQISLWLKEAGFCISKIEEWISDKTSEGGMAKVENRARQEFPLFMMIEATKF
jgi:ubiquinone/menaquinone biosynthesis C-methylase UbiE